MNYLSSLKYLYYPGCTIKRDALEYEEKSLLLLRKMGIELKELESWYCCGALPSLAIDDIMSYVGGTRTLIEAQKLIRRGDFNGLLTLCPMCYNVLKRINLVLENDPDKLEILTEYMEEEERYGLGVNVVHIVEVLAGNIDRLKEIATEKLTEFKVAVYYGCTLLRPKEIAIDDPENPEIIENLLTSLEVAIVDYPFKTECCGSYHILTNRNIVVDRVKRIVSSALRRGANIITVVCPLCMYNLKQVVKEGNKLRAMYLSELLVHLVGDR
ncbi:MAG: disulfide reductase [Thermoprotei archaeon]|nr:MAG: disulfide reductase [Thermoprotei archaeon]